MKLNLLVSRLVQSIKTKGIFFTMNRFFIISKRTLFQNKSIIYCADLCSIEYDNFELPKNYFIEVIQKEEDLSKNNLKQLLKYRPHEILKLQFQERFHKGAVLWLLMISDNVVGFHWSITGQPIKQYFFSFTCKDALLFDSEIFAEFRGQGLNPLLIDYIMCNLKKQGVNRAYIDIRMWNAANIRSITKTKFKKIGIARKVILLGKVFVIWYEMLDSVLIRCHQD